MFLATGSRLDAATAHRPTPTGFHHQGVVLSGTDQLLERTVPFVRDGLDAGDAALVALTAHNTDRLRDALGPDAARVRFVDPDAAGRSPVRRLQGWLDVISTSEAVPAHGRAPRPRRPAAARRLRAITEPVRTDHRPAELAEAHLHEAVLNLAIPAGAPLSLMCVYDANDVTPEDLLEACRTHPHVTGPTQGAPAYAGSDHARRLLTEPLPEPPADAENLAFRPGGLSLVRHLVARVAGEQRLTAERIDDLTVAVNEVAANSLDHGGGRGELRYWAEPGALVIEVRDSGRLTDPLVGRISPESGQSRGRGLWMANQFGDLLQIRSGSAGTTARVTTWI